MTTRIRMAGYQGHASVHTRALHLLANRLDSNYFAAELIGNITEIGHRAADLLALTEQGDLEICYFSSSYLSRRVAELELLDLPFLIENRAQGQRLLDGPLCALLAEKLETASGYRVLGWWDNGFRHLSSRLRAVRSPADCRGQRIRTMGDAPQHERIFQALGFETVPLDVSELLPAIVAGRIDAQENPLTNIWHFDIYKHHPWITLSGHLFGASLLLCNAEFYRRLSARHKAALDFACAAANRAQRDYAADDERSAAQRLARAGIRPTELTAAEREEFKRAVRPTVDAVVQRYLPAVVDMLPPLEAA